LRLYHRLNGSSSAVNGDTSCYGKGQISTLYKIKTPERILTKFGAVAVDYVRDIPLSVGSVGINALSLMLDLLRGMHSQRTYVPTMIVLFLGNNSKLTFLP